MLETSVPNFSDIYLSGPNEKHLELKYKTLIKNALPGLIIYDTSIRPNGDWFINDLFVLHNCNLMAFLVPDFPLPGVAPKIGYFYAYLCQCCKVSLGQPSDRIICIWPENVNPQYGRRVIERMGIIVSTVEEAIDLIKRNKRIQKQLTLTNKESKS